MASLSRSSSTTQSYLSARTSILSSDYSSIITRAFDTPMATPLPRKQMIILSMVIFAEPVSLTILYPFVYFMVRDFHLTDDERDIGYYAGMIAASFSLAQFLTSIPWGMVSNHLGRRPVILIGLLGNVVTSILFGFSKSLQWAIVTRACCGLLNGNIAVAKCVLGEITDSTNQAQAFSMFGFMFGLGSLIAPTLGGLLADPVTKYPLIFGNIQLLRDYPYLLPCLVSSVFSLFGLVMGVLYLEETLGHSQSPIRQNCNVTESQTEEEEEEAGSRLLQTPSQPQLDKQSYLSTAVSPELFPGNKEDSTPAVYDPEWLDNRPTGNNKPADLENNLRDTSACKQVKPVYSRSAFDTFHRSASTITAYTLLALLTIILQEVYVFWCNASPANGGLGWQSTEVGLSMAASGALLLLIQLVVFPRLQKHYGNLWLFRQSMLINGPVCFALPFIHDSLTVGPAMVWTWTLLHHFVRCLCQACCFTTIMIMINNSATSQTLGLVNGIGQASASLVRGIGPALGGWMWQISLKSGLGFPFDYHFVFCLLAAISLLSWLQSYTIPADIDSTSGEQDEAIALLDH